MRAGDCDGAMVSVGARLSSGVIGEAVTTGECAGTGSRTWRAMDPRAARHRHSL